MQNYRAPGNVIELTIGATPIPSGTAYHWGTRAVLAQHDVAANEAGSFVASGVVEMTSGASFSAGDMVQVDEATDTVVALLAGTALGRALSAASGAGEKILIRIEDIGT